jgi:D-alanine-D-alanine ligase
MEKKFHRIAVMYGGPSNERAVSQASGGAIAKALKVKGYEVVELDLPGREVFLPSGIEAVFIAMHGTFGEDGELQKILAKKGVPYTGSGPDASKAAFDKIISKKIFERAGINCPSYEVLKRGRKRTLNVPVVVKPPREGSSVGLTCVMKESDWPDAFDKALAIDSEVMVETFIEGRELTVGVVGEQVLPVIEIRPKGGVYDYEHKYTKGMTEYLCPAPISAEETRMCQELAWKTFEALGCRGMGRVDIRLTPDGIPFVLELNTIPGFTETSLLPKAAKSVGIEFGDLCERILNLAAV